MGENEDLRTSVNAVVFMEIVYCIEDLADCLGSILLSELALFANAVKQLSSGRQLSHNVVLVLQSVRPRTWVSTSACRIPSIRTNRGT